MPEMSWGPERSTAVRSGGDTSKSCKPQACEPAEPLKPRVRGCDTMLETRQHSGPGILHFDRKGIDPGIAACEMEDRNGVPKPASDPHNEQRRAPGETKIPG